MAADCQLHSPGHEIPYLLNRVGEDVRKKLGTSPLKLSISACLAERLEDLYFGESDEHDFRA